MTDHLYLLLLNSRNLMIDPYLEDRVRTAREQVQTVYVEEIKSGEIDQTQQAALELIQVILGEEKVRGYASQTQFMMMYYLHVGEAHTAFGYDDLKELLESFDMVIRGRLHQLYTLATEIVPWCEAHNLTVADQPVNLAFFARFIDGKCLVSRARGVVSRLRAIIHDEALETAKKRQLAQGVFEDLLDPSLTHEVLGQRYNLDAPEEFDIRVWQGNGVVRIEVELTPAQFEWMRKRTGTVVRYEFYDED